MSDALPTYVAVLRARSLVRVRENEQIGIESFPTEVGPVRCTFRTNFHNEGFAVLVPRGVYAEVVSQASSANQALAVANGVAMALKTFLAFSANANVDDFEPEIAFDASPWRTDHEFLQRFVRDQAGIPDTGRWLSKAATDALLAAVAHHPRGDRLSRAIIHYDAALRFWRPEWRTPAVAHLWVGMESITPLARDREMARLGVDKAGLANAWGVEEKHLDAEVRKRLLFAGDDEAYASARKASDGYEHGYADFVSTFKLATAAAERTAAYLRRAVLDLAGLPEEQRQVLLSPPFSEPFENVAFSQWVRGTLHGPVDKLAPPDKTYPMMLWATKLAEFKLNVTSGKYDLSPSISITPLLGEGVVFEPGRIEISGPVPDAQRYGGSAGESGLEGVEVSRQ